MSDTDKDWAEHAAAEGAAVGADPGESGEVSSPTSVGHGRLSVEDNSPTDPAKGGARPPEDTNSSGLEP